MLYISVSKTYNLIQYYLWVMAVSSSTWHKREGGTVFQKCNQMSTETNRRSGTHSLDQNGKSVRIGHFSLHSTFLFNKTFCKMYLKLKIRFIMQPEKSALNTTFIILSIQSYLIYQLYFIRYQKWSELFKRGRWATSLTRTAVPCINIFQCFKTFSAYISMLNFERLLWLKSLSGGYHFNNLKCTLSEDDCIVTSQIVVLERTIFKHFPYIFYVKL